jgi:hypothetical protein
MGVRADLRRRGTLGSKSLAPRCRDRCALH